MPIKQKLFCSCPMSEKSREQTELMGRKAGEKSRRGTRMHKAIRTIISAYHPRSGYKAKQERGQQFICHSSDKSEPMWRKLGSHHGDETLQP